MKNLFIVFQFGRDNNRTCINTFLFQNVVCNNSPIFVDRFWVAVIYFIVILIRIADMTFP